MRKGFTLIELLAAIIILAVILVIAVPQILRVIQNSKEDSFMITTKYLIEGTRKYYEMNGDEIPVDSTKTFTIEDGEFVGDTIPVSGELPQDGLINLNEDGEIRIAVTDGTLCAYKNEYEDEVNIEQMTTTECLDTIDIVYTTDSCFTFDAGTKTITDYDLTNCSMDVVIPNKINNVPVENIKPGAFINPTGQWCCYADHHCDNVASSYVRTGADGYVNCIYFANAGSITSVIFPQTLKTIGYGAFYNHQISSVRLPDSVTDIGEQVFECNEIMSVKLSNNLTKVPIMAFDCNQITSIVIPNSVTSIGEFAFSSNAIQKVIIPSSVTNIDSLAFDDNQITSLSIPSSVKSIGGGAFNENKLPDSSAFIYARNADGTIDNTKIVSYGGTKRTNVVIPNTVTKIGDETFRWNSISGITIPNTVIDIGESAFAGNNLGAVTLPSGLTTIKISAFNTSGLTSINIPNGVTSIYDYAFRNNNLTSIAIPNSVTNIGNDVFRYNKIPQGSATIDRASGSVTLGTNVFANNGTGGATTITPVYLR